MLLSGGFSWSDWAAAFPLYIAAYLFGLITLLVAMRGLWGRRKPGRTEGLSAAVLIGAVAALLGVGIVASAWSPGSGGTILDLELGTAIVLALISITLAYCLRSVRMGAVGLLALRWYGGLLGLLWFGYWLVMDAGSTCYGLWISMLGAAAIVAGTFGEAKTRGGLGRRATLWRLLICGLRERDLDGPRCRQCGYLLIGLTVPRCPECGTAFDPGAQGLQPEP